jgi:hypothetical protein
MVFHTCVQCTLNDSPSIMCHAFSVSGDFHCSVLQYIYVVFFNPLLPSVSFPFLYTLIDLPQIIPLSHSCPSIIIIIMNYHFRSRFLKWPRICDTWFLSLAYLTQRDGLQFHTFPVNDIMSFFFMVE